MKTPAKTKSFKKPPQCQHIKTNGLQCGSPALRDHRFCYFHQRTLDLHHLRRRRPEMRLYIPLLEDANAVQIAIQQVAEAIVEGLKERLAELSAGERRDDSRIEEAASQTVRRIVRSHLGKKPLTDVHIVRI